jgi:tRNA(Ile2) C34 agmatinyltransferase TiaS
VESFNQALIDCVKAAGGSAIVGKKVFPEKSPEAAQRALLDCLNEDRSAKLSPDQVKLVLRLARDKGHHGGIAYLLTDLGYSPTTPIEPKDEAAELSRQASELLAAAERITERLQRLQPQLHMRVAA